MMGKLLYAITENRGTLPGKRLFRFTGIDAAPLETVPYRDLAAVVSEIDLQRFNGNTGEQIQTDLVKYQQVNLSLLQHLTLVPLRFGLTAHNNTQVREVLEKAYVQLKIFLTKLMGKVEFVVQAFWALPQVLQDLAAQHEHIRQLQEQVSRPSLSLSTRQAQEIGRMLFEAAEARRKELASALHMHLLPWAVDSVEGVRKPVLANGKDSEVRQGSELIFNRSYLVDRAKESLFDTAVDQLGTRYRGDITFSYIGPLPPYSFANLAFNQGNYELIDWARKTLALPPVATEEEIKDAYRRLALLCHPDRHPEDMQAGERFRTITHAYEVLETYCSSLQYFLNESPPYSFAREQVEKTFVVREGR